MAMEDIVSIAVLIVIVGCSIAFGLVRFSVRLHRAIRESDSRMNDAAYVAKLRIMGLS